MIFQMIHAPRTSKLVAMTRASYMILLVCSKKLNQLTFCVYPAINRYLYLKCCFYVWTNLCLAYQESHHCFFVLSLPNALKVPPPLPFFHSRYWNSFLQFGMHFLPKFLRYLLYLYSFQRQRWLCKEKFIFNAHKMKSLYPSKILQRTHLTRSCGAMSYCLFEHFSHFIITARNWQFSTKVWTFVIGLSCLMRTIILENKKSL